jgi:hypothetical protein
MPFSQMSLGLMVRLCCKTPSGLWDELPGFPGPFITCASKK